MATSRLGLLLVEDGLLTEADRRTIKRNCGGEGAAFARSILAIGLLAEDELAAFLAEKTQWRVAPIDLLAAAEKEAIDAVDRILMQKLEVIPLRIQDGVLHIAVVDPLDEDTLNQLAFFTGSKVRPVIATLSSIRAALKGLDQEYRPERTHLEAFMTNHAVAASRQLRIGEGQVRKVERRAVTSWPPPAAQVPAPVKAPKLDGVERAPIIEPLHMSPASMRGPDVVASPVVSRFDEYSPAVSQPESEVPSEESERSFAEGLLDSAEANSAEANSAANSAQNMLAGSEQLDAAIGNHTSDPLAELDDVTADDETSLFAELADPVDVQPAVPAVELDTELLATTAAEPSEPLTQPTDDEIEELFAQTVVDDRDASLTTTLGMFDETGHDLGTDVVNEAVNEAVNDATNDLGESGTEHEATAAVLASVDDALADDLFGPLDNESLQDMSLAAGLNRAVLTMSMATNLRSSVERAASALHAAGLSQGSLFREREGAVIGLINWSVTDEGTAIAEDGLLAQLTPGLELAISRLQERWVRFSDVARESNIAPFSLANVNNHELYAVAIPISEDDKLIVIMTSARALHLNSVIGGAALELFKRVAKKT
jgi:hypothetical protein